MDMKELAKYALEFYENCEKYLQMVLRDFPEEKMTEKIGEAKTAAELLFHAVATPHFWMKRAGRGFEFRAKFDTKSEAIERWGQQLEVFRKILEDPEEVHWTPTTSVPWIMIRSCNHLVHHMGMLIYIRNILGLPSLKPMEEGFGWGDLVDHAAKFHYSQK